MSHSRSPEAKLRRQMKQKSYEYVLRVSYNDFIIGEKVCRSEPEEVITYLQHEFPEEPIEPCVVPCTFKGVVLIDGRGNGAFQDVQLNSSL